MRNRLSGCVHADHTENVLMTGTLGRREHSQTINCYYFEGHYFNPTMRPVCVKIPFHRTLLLCAKRGIDSSIWDNNLLPYL